MKLGELSIWVAVCAIAAGLHGCTDTHPTPRDKNTNWLMPCEASNECGGGLDCIADVCTRACDSLEDCSDPELALTCAAGVCAMRTSTMPMAGSGAPMPGPDASTPTPDASQPTPDGGTPIPGACEGEGATRRPGPNLYDRSAAGRGDCSGKTLGDVIAAIQAANPGLADVNYILDPAMPPPPILITSQITAFELDDGFAIVMQKGRGDCESGCIDIEYWYFRTDANCTPQQIGHHKPHVSAASCNLEGYPLWDTPVPTPEYPPTCGAPLSPRPLESMHSVQGCGQASACATSGNDEAEDLTLEVQVEIRRDAADPSGGTVTLRGTGKELLDGRRLAAAFAGGQVRASVDNASLPSTCLMQFSLELLLDFDGNDEGYLRYEEVLTPNCMTGGDYCKGHLNLTFGRAEPTSECFASQDITTAVDWARAPLLACDADEDCATVGVVTECVSTCPVGVRADAVAELEQVIEELEAAFCPGAECQPFVGDCVEHRAVRREGLCTAVPVSP